MIQVSQKRGCYRMLPTHGNIASAMMINIRTVIAVLCLSATLQLQTSPAQAPQSRPSPQPQETGPDVDLLHHLRRATVSLGLRVTINGKERFSTVGSGVIVAWDSYHACLLT